jgi:diaminopimelate decarboxylase
VKLALEAQKLGAGPIRYLNCGGGFPSNSPLRSQPLPPEQVNPSFDRYAEAICDTIIQAWPAGTTLPRLYLETGRALVDEAGYLISTVVALKRRRLSPAEVAAAAPATETSRPAVVLDVGVHLLYTGAWQAPTIAPARATSESALPTTVYGCLCMSIDVIREDAPLPPLNTGERVVIHPVGAYNISQSMQFITYRPAMVMIGPNGAVHLIRRRENLDYVQELESVPEHLSQIEPGLVPGPQPSPNVIPFRKTA